MPKYRRRIIAIRGDTQGGHSGGLLNPETEFPDVDITESGDRIIKGYSHRELRPVQKRLWQWHEEGRQEIQKLAGKDPITFLELGDMTQGDYYKDNLAEAQLNSQVVISRWNMRPWLTMKQVKKTLISKGTSVHVWGDGQSETLLTAWLSALYPEKDIQIAHHWLYNADGFLIDTAHHGSGPGIRNWTKGNVFSLYMKSELRDSLDRGEQPADMFLRAHFHTFTYGNAFHQIDSRIYKAEGYIIPPFCFIGAHAQKVIRSPGRMSIGLIALEIVNGKLLDTHVFLHTLDLRVREVD